MTALLPKAVLRAGLRRRRAVAASVLDPRAAGALLAPPLLQLIAPQRPGCVAGYVAQGGEISALPALAALASAGWSLALPVVLGPGQPLAFRRWAAGVSLSPGLMGVPEPDPGVPAAEPDLLLIPLLGFTRTGGRLGQGGGFYDRTLAARRGGPRPLLAIGLAYAVQEMADLPLEAHDARLDAVVTEAGVAHDGIAGAAPDGRIAPERTAGE